MLGLNTPLLILWINLVIVNGGEGDEESPKKLRIDTHISFPLHTPCLVEDHAVEQSGLLLWSKEKKNLAEWV